MARGFITGVLWGVVVVGAGLTVLSQLAPPPKSMHAVAPVVKVAVAGTSDISTSTLAAPAAVAMAAPALTAPRGPIVSAPAATARTATASAAPVPATAPPVAPVADAPTLPSSTQAELAVAAPDATAPTTATPAPVTSSGTPPADAPTPPLSAPAEPPVAAPDAKASTTAAPALVTLDATKAREATASAAAAATPVLAPDAASVVAGAGETTPEVAPSTSTPGVPGTTAAPATPDPTAIAAATTPANPPAVAPAAPPALAASALAPVEPVTPAPVAPTQVAAADTARSQASLQSPQMADAAPAKATAPAQQDVAPQPAAPAQTAPRQTTPDAAAAAVSPGPLPDVAATTEAPPSLAGLDHALTAPVTEPAPATTDPAPPEPEGTRDALLAPGQASGQSEPTRLPQITPAADPAVVADAPQPVAPPASEVLPKESKASTLGDKAPSTLPPAKGLVDKVPTTLPKVVPGVEVGKLPQVGVAAVSPDAAKPADDRPITRNARKFDGPQGKPLFVILLHDVGATGMSRDALARLPFPVSFVVDPLATDAAVAEAAYRAAGQEVLTLANGIPPGATAGDVAETFQTLANILPDSVAVIDEDVGGFQDNRPLATLVLPVVQDQGRGLVTYDRGLNAADQIARRNGIPAAVIFRRLDGAGEGKDVIRRYLDRAAFKAAQEGQVVVIGDTRADTVAAILEWTVEGRASSVTLAPVTAVLNRP